MSVYVHITMYMENKYSELGLNASIALGFALCYIIICFSFHWWQCYCNIALIRGTSFLGHVLPCVLESIMSLNLTAQFSCDLLECLISS